VIIFKIVRYASSLERWNVKEFSSGMGRVYKANVGSDKSCYRTAFGVVEDGSVGIAFQETEKLAALF
jgi:hypothetical protein